MVYSVPQYLKKLELAKRSPTTILEYRNELGYFAKFLKVPIEELHNHLLPENLINYAATRIGKSEAGTTVRMGIISRFYNINGVKFDELDLNILKTRSSEEQDDKPLELETLQKMMDLGDIHAKTIISFLISTGIRAGELTKIKLSDVSGNTVKIRNEIAKGKRGGTVYLTAETQEYLSLWMKDRDRYLAIAAARTYYKNVPAKDDRLFLCSYSTLRGIWSRLYDAVDGETGKYGRGKNTIHSARKYFRTHAVKTMPIDVVEKIMRHSGYLTRSYVRISDEEVRKQFHEGEAALYITRADHRIQGSKLSQLEQNNTELKARLQQVEQQKDRVVALERENQKLQAEVGKIKDIEKMMKSITGNPEAFKLMRGIKPGNQ